MVGREHFIDAGRFLPARFAARPPAANGAPREALPTASVREEDLRKCARLLIQFRDRVRSNEIWLGPFYKAAMNDAFVTLTQEERKAIVNRLKEMGAIRIETREGHTGTPYAVVFINDAHAVIQAAHDAEAEDAPAGAGEAGS
jgi:hypothetical protein